MKYDTIIFDLGGVLIDWNPDYVFTHLIPDAGRRRFFFENVCTHDWNLEQDAGRSLAEATDELLEKWPEWEVEIRAFYGRWEEMLGGPLDETVALLEALKERTGYRLLALTNWSAETFPIALDRYAFLHWFEGIVVSGAEKTRKPFAAIYQLLLKRYAVAPEKAVFIDDNLANIQAAEVAGIKGIHFRDAETLRQALTEHGFVIP